MNQLITGQLDMDRLDYLKRDSFYTGVAEGNINAERLITMLNVVDDRLVVEEKGIYSVEKFLMARRFMYWQVYLHKTGIVAEQLLIKTLQRAKEVHQHSELPGSDSLRFFMERVISLDDFDAEALKKFVALDDIDIMAAIKNWSTQQDPVLSRLCRMILDRKFLRIKLKNNPVKEQNFLNRLERCKERYSFDDHQASYFVFKGQIENTAYSGEEKGINILLGNGELTDVAAASDHLNLKALSSSVVKYFYCYPKDLD